MIKKILIGIVLLSIATITVFILINTSNPTEAIPEISTIQGKEVDYRTREWWESTTVYQVYPRSFQDSDGDGIGDIAGIISRLDYIKDLGFETIWFSPFFKSPQKDFGYDISDYILPDPDYGDSPLIDSLIKEVHKRDMKIVFDLVLNHTSEEHPWFIESRSSKDNPKSDWYVWKEGKGDLPPTNWQSALGMNGWHYDSIRTEWYFSSFLEFQPDLNWRNPEVKEAMFEVERHWLDKGVDGFRLDIFNFVYEDKDFRDNPFSLRVLPTPDLTKMLWQHRLYSMNQDEVFDLARELRSVLDEYTPSRFLVGEVFGDNQTLRRFMGENNDGLNLVFLFDISDLKWEASFFRNHISRFEAFYPYPYQPTYVFSNHDRARSISLLENDSQKAQTLALLQLTLRGVPFFYYGEEIGMSNSSIPFKEALDPLPHAFSWLPDFLQSAVFNRDNYRTPMQWNSEPNAGFTDAAANPWLPLADGSDTVNVEIQEKTRNAPLPNLKRLLQIREQEPSVKWGSLKWIEEHNSEDLLAFERIYRNDKVSVFINFSDHGKEIDLGRKMQVLHSTGAAIMGASLQLDPKAGAIVKE